MIFEVLVIFHAEQGSASNQTIGLEFHEIDALGGKTTGKAKRWYPSRGPLPYAGVPEEYNISACIVPSNRNKIVFQCHSLGLCVRQLSNIQFVTI